MNAETAKPIVMTQEQAQAMLDAIKARIMKACRHLTASRMSHNMRVSGHDYTRCTKSYMAEECAHRLCGQIGDYHPKLDDFRIPTEAQIEAVCHRFRIVENSDGRFGVIEADRAPLTARIELLRASIAADEAKLKVIKAAGKVNYAIENPMEGNKRYLRELEWCLATIESRVRAQLVEEGKDPDTDSDHAIANEVRAEKRAAHEEMVKKNVEAMTPTQRQTWEHQRRLTRDFPGIEREVDCLFYKNEGATTSYRLKLLWGFVKAEQIDFKQFERLVALINCPEKTG